MVSQRKEHGVQRTQCVDDGTKEITEVCATCTQCVDDGTKELSMVCAMYTVCRRWYSKKKKKLKCVNVDSV